MTKCVKISILTARESMDNDDEEEEEVKKRRKTGINVVLLNIHC